MKIDNTNKELIINRDVYIHDYIFKDIQFQYFEKTLSIILLEENNEHLTNILCHNVYGFEMLSGDFWGKSPHVLDWEICEECEKTLTKKIVQEKMKYLYSDTQESLLLDFLEIKIILTSGDSLKVCCQYLTLEGYK